MQGRTQGLILAPFLLVLGTCVSYSPIPPEGVAEGVFNPGVAAKVVDVEFLGFTDQNRYVEPIRAVLERGGWELQRKSPVLLEVILEERPSTSGLLRILNLIATVGSGALLPFYNQVNYRLRFRRLRAGRLLDSCVYNLRNDEYFSLLLLPAAPLYWSTKVLRKRMELATAAYMAGCGVMKE